MEWGRCGTRKTVLRLILHDIKNKIKKISRKLTAFITKNKCRYSGQP